MSFLSNIHLLLTGKAKTHMTAPTVTSVTVTPVPANPGDELTATVAFTPGTTEVSQTITGTADDSTSGLTGTLNGTFTVNAEDPTTVTVTDSGSRVWTQVSDDGSTAVFTATA